MAPPRTRVLFVVGTLTGGGAERFVSTCLVHLDRRRFEPALALMRREVTYPLPDDVPLTVLGKHRPWHTPRAIRRLARCLNELRPHVVLSALPYASVVTGAALRRTRAQPTWVARTANHPRCIARGLRGFFRRAAYRRADLVLANSRGSAAAFVAKFPFARETIRVLPNPTDFGRIDRLALGAGGVPRSAVATVVAIGRLVAQKRPDLLVEAFARARRRVEARLLICGDGPLRAAVRRRVERLGLTAHVHLAGFVDNPYAWMAASDLFALTSDYEGLPNALIEAQGLGLPAVSTDCPFGPNEIIEPGVTGLLVPPGDVAALADAMAQLLADPERRRALGAAARRRARALYGIEDLLPSLHELLEEAAGRAFPPVS